MKKYHKAILVHYCLSWLTLVDLGSFWLLGRCKEVVRWYQEGVRWCHKVAKLCQGEFRLFSDGDRWCEIVSVGVKKVLDGVRKISASV